ncbi:hypothetical protein D3C85_1125320 [compost metagenome]
MKRILYEGYVAAQDLKRNVVLLYSDASTAFEIKGDSFSYKQRRPVRSAATLAKGDACLTQIEDATNTIVSPRGQTYVRRDDVWFCTEGPLVINEVEVTAMEKHTDLRYIELHTYTPCGTVLGLPMAWQVIVERNQTGQGDAIWRRCFATEPWQQLSKTSTITFQ